MNIETDRLWITDLTMDMAEAIHLNSLDEDNRRFVPDEVFETIEEAQETVAFLIQAAQGDEGPFVHPIIRKADGANIGYVQLCRVDEGFEIGYHIAKAYTGNGYATEAVQAFLQDQTDIWGIALEENAASHKVLEKCGFRLAFQGRAMYQGEERSLRKYRYMTEKKQ